MRIDPSTALSITGPHLVDSRVRGEKIEIVLALDIPDLRKFAEKRPWSTLGRPTSQSLARSHTGKEKTNQLSMSVTRDALLQLAYRREEDYTSVQRWRALALEKASTKRKNSL